MTREEAIQYLEGMRIDRFKGYDSFGEFIKERNEAIDMAISALSAERVVRCKDCEYWQDNNGGYPHEECRWGKEETPYEDDFCSYGVAKMKGGVD